jgi:benzoylformate decarboxylase
VLPRPLVKWSFEAPEPASVPAVIARAARGGSKYQQPRSFYRGAGGALGFALPAAVGVSLADEKLPVVALIGDGSANYSITGLWTASRLKLPCAFVIIRNGVYEVLNDYGNSLGIEGVPGMALPGS